MRRAQAYAEKGEQEGTNISSLSSFQSRDSEALPMGEGGSRSRGCTALLPLAVVPVYCIQLHCHTWIAVKLPPLLRLLCHTTALWREGRTRKRPNHDPNVPWRSCLVWVGGALAAHGDSREESPKGGSACRSESYPPPPLIALAS